MQVKLADLSPLLEHTHWNSVILWFDCFSHLLLFVCLFLLSLPPFFNTYTMLWSLLSLTHTHTHSHLLCTPSYIQSWTLSEPHSCLKLRLANEEMSFQLSGLDAKRKTCRISPTASSVLSLANLCVCVCISTVSTHIHSVHMCSLWVCERVCNWMWGCMSNVCLCMRDQERERKCVCKAQHHS